MKYYQKCIKSASSASASGGLRPQTPYRGSAPGPRWGTPVPQTPCGFAPILNLLPPPMDISQLEWTFIIISSLLLDNKFLTSFLCVSIPLCSLLPVWVQQSYHHLPNRAAFEFFFSLLLVYLSFCLQQFHAKVRRVWKHDQSIDVSSICLSSFTFRRTSLSVTLSSQPIFSILIHIHISKASNHLLSV